MRLNEQQLRALIRKIINESWARDPGTGAPPTKTSGMVEDHADPSGATWDAGLDESDEDHSDEHTCDPRWDDHGDPTGKEWPAGLDEDIDA
jgi:hypothetical protein